MLLDVGEAISYFCLPLGVLVKHILDVLLCLFNICQPGVEAGVLHLLVMISHWLIMIAMGREGHTSSLVAAWNYFIGLLLIVVEVAFLPVLTWALLPGALRVLGSRMLSPSMFGLVHAGGSRLIPACIAGESRSLENWIITMVPGLRVVSQSCRDTSTRCCLHDQ